MKKRMFTATGWSGLRPERRGYSLIEVLIATTVLGLGTLGLIAVIAGSATQQQTASMQNLSVGVVNNADGMLGRLLGRTGLSLGSIPEGQWTTVITDVDSHFLTVAPGYLLVGFPEDTEVYSLGYSVGQQVPFSDVNSLLNQGTLSAGTGTFLGTTIPLLRHRRVDLESGLVVTIEILTHSGPGSPERFEQSDILTFVTPSFLPTGSDIVSLELVGAGVDYFGSTLTFDRRENLLQGAAGIDSFNIAGMTNKLVNSVTVSPYQWRNDQLVSLSDRLVTENEPTYPGGKRPIMGYSALIRESDASTQLCFFTYTLRALSLPEEMDSFRFRGLAFVPPDTREDVQNETSVLREVRLELGYEELTQRYFFEISQAREEEFGWVLDQGQILMVSSLEGVLNNALNPADPGADFPVRVFTNRIVERNGVSYLRAYLDRSPRINGRTPLEDLTDPEGREEMYVWAVQPVVKSLTDETEWLLNVVDARVIQVTEQ